MIFSFFRICESRKVSRMAVEVLRTCRMCSRIPRFLHGVLCDILCTTIDAKHRQGRSGCPDYLAIPSSLKNVPSF